MKKIIIITALFLMIFSMTAMGKYTRPYQPPARKKCSVSGCDRNRSSDSIYCDKHKCAQRGCTRKRQSGGIYCATHEEYIGILEDYIVSKQSLEDFMREYPFYSGKSMKK